MYSLTALFSLTHSSLSNSIVMIRGATLLGQFLGKVTHGRWDLGAKRANVMEKEGFLKSQKQ